MKLVLATPGYPDRDRDGRARRARALATGAAAAGCEVLVLSGGAGSGGALLRRGERDGEVDVLRLERGDPHPTHWMRAGSVEVARVLRGLLHERAPDVLHVVGWERLTDDLVLTAARAGVPAVVELDDQRATCLLATRRRPEDGSACTRTYGPYECVPCAARVPPATPWVPTDQAYLGFGQRAAALGRELALARARLVPDEEHGGALLRALEGGLPPLIVAPEAADGAGLAFHLDLWRRVADLGAPPPEEAGQEAWFEERMRAAAERAWDEAARA